MKQMTKQRGPRPGRRAGPGGRSSRPPARQFAAHGYDGVSMRAIAADAEVDVALVSYYFGSKNGLFVASLQLPVNPADVIAALLAGRARRSRRAAAAPAADRLGRPDDGRAAHQRPALGLEPGASCCATSSSARSSSRLTARDRRARTRAPRRGGHVADPRPRLRALRAARRAARLGRPRRARRPDRTDAAALPRARNVARTRAAYHGPRRRQRAGRARQSPSPRRRLIARSCSVRASKRATSAETATWSSAASARAMRASSRAPAIDRVEERPQLVAVDVVAQRPRRSARRTRRGRRSGPRPGR